MPLGAPGCWVSCVMRCGCFLEVVQILKVPQELQVLFLVSKMMCLALGMFSEGKSRYY